MTARLAFAALLLAASPAAASDQERRWWCPAFRVISTATPPW